MIEIKDFYPLEYEPEKNFLSGTMRVRLVDAGIDILGIYVTKKGDAWFFNMPGKKGIHHETGEPVRYPFVVFTERERQSGFMKVLREQGKAFVEARLADTRRPIVCPPRPQQASPAASPTKPSDKVTEAAVAASNSKPAPALKELAQKKWITPPPRKLPASASKFSRKGV